MDRDLKMALYGLIACLLFVIALIVATVLWPGSQTGATPDSGNTCVFIDHHVHVDGVLIQGKNRGLMIDFPTYSFDKQDRVLSGMINFEINDSLLAVMGDGQSLGGAMGGGAGTMLYGVYALPYKGRGPELMSIAKNGTAAIQYRNDTIVLLPGAEWTKITSEIQTIDNFDGNKSIINVTTTDRIVNYGLIDRNNILKR
jgi:hypothetical protein